MKYPEFRMSLEAALPSTNSVHSWLGHQLEVRGIDSIVYTRYLISLIQHDHCEQFDKEELWDGLKYDHCKKREKKGDKKKSPVSDEERRKMAVLDCLQSVSDQDCDLENLVDELWKRLKEPQTLKDCSTPLSVNIQPSTDSNKKQVDVNKSQDPAQRYYAAFPSLSGEDSPSAISPSACEPNVWKRNPLKTSSATETSSKTDKKSGEKTVNDTIGRSETKSRQDHPVHQTKKRSKSMTDTKINDQKTQKVENKKKVYPKQNKPKQQNKMQKVIKKHGNTVRFLSWPLTSQKQFETENDGKDEKQKEAEAEYCNKVEQIIKTLLLSGISDQQKKSDLNTEWPEWMREDSLSPELQENFEWYTQPLGEILVTPSSSKRLYKRHSYPPSLLFEDDSDLEAILGPLLSSVTSRYKFVDDVFSPIAEDSTKKGEDNFDMSQAPELTGVSSDKHQILVPQEKSKEEMKEPTEAKLNVHPFTYTLDYSSPTTGLFTLFDNFENTNTNTQELCSVLPQGSVIGEQLEQDKVTLHKQGILETEKNLQTLENVQEEIKKSLDLGKQRFESLLNLSDENRRNPLAGGFDDDQEVSNAWYAGPDIQGGTESNSFPDFYDISSCSTSFDSEEGTDMSDFEGIFTFDMESQEDFSLENKKQNIQSIPQTEDDLYFDLGEEPDVLESPYSLDVPESTFFTEELMKSFNSVIDSPRNSGVFLVESPRNNGVCSLLMESPRTSGVCSMLIDRQYLTETMLDLQDRIEMQSPFASLSPSLSFNIWSVNESPSDSSWQSKLMLHELFHSIDEDFRITSVPWDSVLGDTGLRWNLTPKNESENMKEKTKPGQFYQLWNVNTQKKIPWTNVIWNVPYNVATWSLPDNSREEYDPETNWDPAKEQTEDEIEEGEIYLSQTDDAVIGIDLLEELHKQSPKDKSCMISLRVNSFEKQERSVSDSDIHGMWSKFGSAKPEFHRSFELVPSETSAFTDVVPGKMIHVRSEPNLKYSSLMSSTLDSSRFEEASRHPNESGQHLYFSNETHFRPIQTPIGTPHEEKYDRRGDLFGDLDLSTGTPYQQFHQPGSIEEKLPMFRPKFKVQKDLDKYIQTGRSLEDNYDSKDVKKQSESKCEQKQVLSKTTDGIDCDLDDPHGKESGFESNGEVEDSILLLKDDSDDLGYDWMEDSGLEAKFHHLYLDDSDHYLPATLTNLWKGDSDRPEKEGLADYSKAWSSGYDVEETGTEGFNYLQYLPLVQHGELQFDTSHKIPSTLENKQSILDYAGNDSTLRTEGQQIVIESHSEGNEFDTPKGHDGFIWPGEQLTNFGDTKESMEVKRNEILCDKTVKKTNPLLTVDYNLCVDENDFPVNSIPNSVDELSQYYLGNLVRDGNIDHQQSTHELLHTHGYSVEMIPNVPIPETAVYSYDLEQEELMGGGGMTAPGLPEVAVYSSDLEKQWLDSGQTATVYPDEWPPYLNVPDPKKKVKTKKGASKKPCSFFLEGACKRSDCKFSHDLSTITCRFWQDGMCFKGPLCPFLHGYHIISDSDTNSVESNDSKFELKKEEFPELKTSRNKEGIDEKLKKNEKNKEKKKKIVSTKVHKVN